MSLRQPNETAIEQRDEMLCRRCGALFLWDEQPVPDDASIYWVPSCPCCGAKATATTVDKAWLNIIGGDSPTEPRTTVLHAQARLYHGRMVDRSVDELIELAQHFDARASYGKKWGPNPERTVAFNLRKQAREQAML